MNVVAVDFAGRGSVPAIRPAREEIHEECLALLKLGDNLSARLPQTEAVLRTWRDAVTALSDADLTPATAEAELDRLAQALRRICLAQAHAAPAHGIAALEARLDAYAPAPGGWHADHLLFSSAAAAMHCLLLALSPRGANPAHPPRVRHLGGNFETEELLAMLSDHGILRALPAEGGDHTDVLILEPVYFDRAAQMHRLDLQAALDRHCATVEGCPSLVIVDSTLAGPGFALDPLLPEALSCAEAGHLLVRMSSGPELDQAGLALADVGMVSHYRHKRQGLAIDPAEKLRKIRTLTGAGLSNDAIGALEAPWFLDRAHALGHAEAVFENNALLAHRLAEIDGLFSQVSHPGLGSLDDEAEAPFVLIQLEDDTPANYHKLEHLIAREAKARGLHFDRGGSFGFRGHRYEAVLPQAGEITPFLRVALGARKGWSRDGIIDLLCEIARARSVDAF